MASVDWIKNKGGTNGFTTMLNRLLPKRFSNKIEGNGISEDDFEEIVKYANMQHQNAFKKLRSIEN